ncbi:MAG: OmpA family protein [Chitinophagaceae bacterium]
MMRKKFTLSLLAIGFLGAGTFAQEQSGTYDVYDSTVVRAKSMPQQNEFWNNQYSFPARPRNMWEIGLAVGAFTISSDVPARFPTLGGSIHFRKALGYVFSIRAQYLYGIGKGLHFASAGNFAKNTALNNKYNAPVRTSSGSLIGTLGSGPFQKVFYNYKATVQDIGLQGIFTLNNIRFHKQKSGLLIYAGLGIGATLYHTEINALNGTASYAALYNSISVNDQTYKNRKTIYDKLKSEMDDSYETNAENQGNRRPRVGKNTLKPSGTLLGGVAFKLGKRINLAIEDRFTFIKDDLLDGQRWQESANGDAALTPNNDAYNYASIGLNYNFRGKSVEPLWWLNPLDYAYSELNSPRHMKLPEPILDDTDEDGVIDKLDKEPNTPAGCPVDSRGVTADRDGDGVADCKDKQLITPSECQPVDADGVGKCPEPVCCTIRDSTTVAGGGCSIGDLPSISFRGNTTSLSADAKSMLANVSSRIKSNPTCMITIVGYSSTNKAAQSQCQKRVAAIKDYLVESQSVSSDRISTDCQVGGGDANTVDIKVNM